MAITTENIDGRGDLSEDTRVRFWVTDREFIEARMKDGGVEIYASRGLSITPEVSNKLMLHLGKD